MISPPTDERRESDPIPDGTPVHQLGLRILGRSPAELRMPTATRKSKDTHYIVTEKPGCLLPYCVRSFMHPCAHAPIHPYAPMHSCAHVPMRPCAHVPIHHVPMHPPALSGSHQGPLGRWFGPVLCLTSSRSQGGHTAWNGGRGIGDEGDDAGLQDPFRGDRRPRSSEGFAQTMNSSSFTDAFPSGTSVQGILLKGSGQCPAARLASTPQDFIFSP